MEGVVQPTRKVTFELSEQVHRNLRVYAAEEGISASEAARRILSAAFAEEDDGETE